MICRLVLGICMLAFALFAPNASAAAELLANHERNKDWLASDGGARVVFIGGADVGVPALVLNRAALMGKATRFVIHTDSRTIELLNGDSFVEAKLATSGKAPASITIDASGQLPRLMVENKEDVVVAGALARLMMVEEADEIIAAFPNAKHVVLEVSAKGGQAAEPSAVPGSAQRLSLPAEAGVPSVPAVAGSDFLERAQNSVVQVLATTARAQSTGTGFFVAGGFIITNFHVIHGATEAEVMVAGAEVGVPVELWAVDTGVDLAVLRLKMDGVAEDLPPPLPLPSDDTKAGTEVWALGYPLGVGYTVTRGIVNGVRNYGDMPKDFQGFGYAKDSAWVQTDCTINAGNSGGPLINSRGEVVGINTWKSSRGSNLYFALSSKHLRQMLAAPRSEPLTFAAAAGEFESLPVRHTSTIPSLVLAQDRPPTLARGAAAVYQQRSECRSCSGSGEKDVRVTTSRGDGMIRTKSVTTTQKDCETCSGTGMIRPEGLRRLLTTVAEHVAHADTSAADWEESKRAIRGNLSHYVGAKGALIAQALRTEARQVLLNDGQTPGVPVAAAGKLLTDFKYDLDRSRYQLAYLWSTREMIVLADTKILDAAPGEQVLLGGVLAGFLYLDGDVVPVIQGGFAVTPKERWTE